MSDQKIHGLEIEVDVLFKNKDFLKEIVNIQKNLKKLEATFDSIDKTAKKTFNNIIASFKNINNFFDYFISNFKKITKYLNNLLKQEINSKIEIEFKKILKMKHTFVYRPCSKSKCNSNKITPCAKPTDNSDTILTVFKETSTLLKILVNNISQKLIETTDILNNVTNEIKGNLNFNLNPQFSLNPAFNFKPEFNFKCSGQAKWEHYDPKKLNLA